MTSFTPDRSTPGAHPSTTQLHPDTTFREDTTHMFQADIRLAEIREQHERHRLTRHGERHGSGRERSIRLRLGESLMRLGRRIGGDALGDGRTDTLTTPAWQG